MSMDLDSLRGRWQESGRRADAALKLDAEAMRAALQARTHKAFRRHSGWLLAGLVGSAPVLAALLVFFLRHLGDWRYALMSGGLLALVGAEFVVDLRQFFALRKLSLDAPVLAVRAVLDGLRARRVTMTKWIALTALLLWWPALLVAFKALTGVDALRFLHASVIWANLGLGLAAIPFGLWLSSWLSRRYGASPGYRRLQSEAAGASWLRAEDAFAAREDFETRAAEGRLEADLPAVELPLAWQAPLRALRRRLACAIGLYASLMLATGVFNAMHGGQAAYITAGVLANALWLSQLIGAILHRRAAMAPAPGVSLPSWREALASVARGRERILLSKTLANAFSLDALAATRRLLEAP